jgi:large subunit ribosomal protein L29
MKKQQLDQLRSQNPDQLNKLLQEEEQNMVKTRLEKATGKLKNPHQLFFLRKKIAVIKTLIREKQLQNLSTNK